MTNGVAHYVVVSARKSGERALSELLGYSNLTSLRGPEYVVNSTDPRARKPEDIAMALGARYDRSKIDLILEFGKDSKENKRLCEMLHSIPVNEDEDKSTIPNINSMILCYEHGIPKELEECQRFCLEKSISYDVLWAHTLSSKFGRALAPSFSVINLRLSMEDIPKADFLKEIALYIPEDLAFTTDKDKVIDEKFWYWDEQAAAYYNYLIESSPYDVFKKPFYLLTSNSYDLIDRTFKIVNKTSKTNFPALDFVALGVGSAQKELHILQEIFDYYRKAAHVSRKLSYVPVDISFPLLQNSIRSLLQDKQFEDYLYADTLNIQPILTNILALRRDQIAGHVNKLIAALGLLWNVPITKAFDAFAEIVNEQSLLLVDVEFVGSRSLEEIIEPYDNEYSKRFFFHSLELLNRASHTEAFFRAHGYPRKKFYSDFREYTWNEKKILVEVVEGSNARSFIDELGLPRSAQNHLEFGPLKNSKTVIVYYQPDNDRLSPIVLGYSTRFEYPEYRDFIHTKTNFKIEGEPVLDTEEEDEANYGYFLLRPSSNSKV